MTHHRDTKLRHHPKLGTRNPKPRAWTLKVETRNRNSKLVRMVAEVTQNRWWQVSGSIQKWLNWIGPLLGLALVILIFSILMDSPGRYLSAFNLRIVLAQTDRKSTRLN